MKLVALDLSHQQLITEKFQFLGVEMSEYSFANLYLFRNIYQFNLCFEKELFIKGTTRDNFSFLMPAFRFTKNVDRKEWDRLLLEVDGFFPIPEQDLQFFDSSQFQFSYLDNDSDYLFSLEKMRTLSGLSPKRNLIKQLLESHTVKVEDLTKEKVKEALFILEEWQKQSVSKKTDYSSCKEGLELMEQLHLLGWIIYVDEKPSGFVLGESPIPKHFMAHFVKAKKEIKGLYQYIYQSMAEHLDADYEYINLEEDLGSPGVRQSKHSYHPIKMLKKWRVSALKPDFFTTEITENTEIIKNE